MKTTSIGKNENYLAEKRVKKNQQVWDNLLALLGDLLDEVYSYRRLTSTLWQSVLLYQSVVKFWLVFGKSLPVELG
jgi:energy-converting hydrogenase Eha subunit F